MTEEARVLGVSRLLGQVVDLAVQHETLGGGWRWKGVAVRIGNEDRIEGAGASHTQLKRVIGKKAKMRAFHSGRVNHGHTKRLI